MARKRKYHDVINKSCKDPNLINGRSMMAVLTLCDDPEEGVEYTKRLFRDYGREYLPRLVECLRGALKYMANPDSDRPPETKENLSRVKGKINKIAKRYVRK